MIETERLQLIPCELSHFEAMLRNESELGKLLNVALAEDWLGFPAAKEAMPYSYEYLKANPHALGWWTYLFIHMADHALIGLGGFKGLPDESGMVEIGYSLAPTYRGQGLATEAAHALIKYAFQHPEVTRADAHTLAEKNPSTRVLQRVGMKFIQEKLDPEDGPIWHWSMKREEYS